MDLESIFSYVNVKDYTSMLCCTCMTNVSSSAVNPTQSSGLRQ
jgi:hypothetical protein